MGLGLGFGLGLGLGLGFGLGWPRSALRLSGRASRFLRTKPAVQ